MKVAIHTSFGDHGAPLSELSKLLKKRLKFAKESARDSVAAIAAESFKSIRTATKKYRGRKVKVVHA